MADNTIQPYYGIILYSDTYFHLYHSSLFALFTFIPLKETQPFSAFCKKKGPEALVMRHYAAGVTRRRMGVR